MMIDATLIKVMNSCNNYFAVLCERVTGAQTSGAVVTAEGFNGHYAEGMLLRIHGAYTLDYGDFQAGELYEVVSFDGTTLTLDHDVHTKAPNLFISYCEPTGDFCALCEEIAAYEAKAAGREGLASESIDGYSWSAAGSGTGFADVFADQLKGYRLPKPTPLYYARWATPWL